ncbi:MAG: hypothetical protein LBN96_01580, partial [Desulfovibrio sp.]|nr:hypothetical protein [Desulfovibrio sp.]
MYDNLLKDGVPEDAAHTWSAVYGAAAGALEWLGLESVLMRSAFKGMMKDAAEGGVKSGLKYGAARAGIGFLGEGGTEYLQNLTAAGFEAVAKDMTMAQGQDHVKNAAKNIEDFIFGGIMGGAVGGVHSRAEARGERSRMVGDALRDAVRKAMYSDAAQAARREINDIAREATMAEDRLSFAQSLEQLAAGADTSATKSADPRAFEQEARHLIPEEARSVWLDVDTVLDFAQGRLGAPEPSGELNQTEAARAEETVAIPLEQQDANLERLGVTREALDNAVATGARAVEVDTAAIISRFDGAERQALLEAARRDPDGMTAHEARLFDPKTRAEEAAQRIRDMRASDDGVRAEGAKLAKRYAAAGYSPDLAEYYATLNVEQAKAFADRYGLDAAKLLEQRRVLRERAEAAAGGDRLLQLNPDVDPEAPVNVVRVAPRFAGQNPLVLRKRFPKEIREQVLAEFEAGVVNGDTGMTVGMSGKDFREHLAFDGNASGLVHLEAIAVLPGLMRNARRIESHSDMKPSEGSKIKKIHRFISAFGVDGNDYSVLLTVKEFEDGSARLDTENPVRLYHHRVEKQMPSVTSNALPIEPAGGQTTPGTSVYTIREMLSGVNDSVGNPYFEQREFKVFNQYAGVNSRMSELVRGRLDEAVILAESGTDNEAVRQKTGWFKGMDGKWRYEIPDNIDEVDFSAVDENGAATLGDIYYNPALYEAYPQLERTPVTYLPFVGNLDGSSNRDGYFNPQSNSIVVNADGHSPEQTLIHEIQHAIQRLEGFARGGSPNEFASGPMFSKKARDLAGELSEAFSGGVTMRPSELNEHLALASEEQNGKMAVIAERHGFASLSDAMKYLLAEDKKRTPFGQYRRLAGEIEARDTGRRSGLTDEERPAKAPDLRSDAIVLFRGEQVAAMSISPEMDRAAKVRAIQAMPATPVTPGAPLDKKAAENLARSFGKMENRRDQRVAELPVDAIGKILRHKGFDVSTILTDLPTLYENAIPAWSEEEKPREGHKAHPNIVGYHNYVNKFEQGGKQYFIRFTIQEMKAKPGQEKSLVHSSFVSEVAIYEENAPSRWGRVIDPVMGEQRVVRDQKLQDFFNSVNPNPTLNSGARGAVSFDASGGSVTSFFESADLSTPIHESAHVFVNDLIRVVMDNGAEA